MSALLAFLWNVLASMAGGFATDLLKRVFKR
jgi:hypothetical protein